MTDMPVGDRKPLAPPVDETGPLGWARKNLFSSWGNGITTVVLIAAVVWVLSWFLEWALFTANFTASTGAECRGGRPGEGRRGDDARHPVPQLDVAPPRTQVVTAHPRILPGGLRRRTIGTASARPSGEGRAPGAPRARSGARHQAGSVRRPAPCA